MFVIGQSRIERERGLAKIQSWSDALAKENALRAAPRISERADRVRKFEAQAMRDAPNVSMTLPKNVSGAPLPQLLGVTLIGVTLR